MARDIVYTRAAGRALRRMPDAAEALVRGKLRQYAQEPDALASTVKALKGPGRRCRLRVGDWRAVFTIQADRIIIHDIGPCGSIYG